MGLDNFLKNRSNRINDPNVIAAHKEEWERVREYLSHARDDAKENAADTIYHSLKTFTKTFVALTGVGQGQDTHGKKGKKGKHGSKHGETAGRQAVGHFVEASSSAILLTVQLVGRILIASGRVTKYGVRRGLAI